MLSTGGQAGQVTAIPIQGTKGWHQYVTPDNRNLMVYKLVQGFLPFPVPSNMQGEQMHELVAHARKMEGGFYEMAKSRCDYHLRIADTANKEVRRQRRKWLEQAQDIQMMWDHQRMTFQHEGCCIS